MIPFKCIFRLIAILAIVAGIFFYKMGMTDVADMITKSGLLIMLVSYILAGIRIPRNSMGTPLEKGLGQERLRMILRNPRFR